MNALGKLKAREISFTPEIAASLGLDTRNSVVIHLYENTTLTSSQPQFFPNRSPPFIIWICSIFEQ